MDLPQRGPQRVPLRLPPHHRLLAQTPQGQPRPHQLRQRSRSLLRPPVDRHRRRGVTTGVRRRRPPDRGERGGGAEDAPQGRGVDQGEGGRRGRRRVVVGIGQGGQGEGGVGGALEPPLRAEAQQILEPALEAVGHRQPGAERAAVAAEVREGDREDVLRRDGRRAGGQGPGEAAEGVQVRPRPERAGGALELLGGHVERSSRGVVAVGLQRLARVGLDAAGQPEVDELQPRPRVALRPEQHVGRLDVQVQHPARVGVGQRVQQPQEHRPEPRPAQRRAVWARQGLQRAARGQLHRQPGAACAEGAAALRRRGGVHDAVLEHGHDRRMIERRDRPHLRPQHREHVAPPRRRRGDPLDRDREARRLVHRAQHDAHAAAPQHVPHHEVPEPDRPHAQRAYPPWGSEHDTCGFPDGPDRCTSPSPDGVDTGVGA